MVPLDPHPRRAVLVLAVEAQNGPLRLDEPVPTDDEVTDLESDVDDRATERHGPRLVVPEQPVGIAEALTVDPPTC